MVKKAIKEDRSVKTKKPVAVKVVKEIKTKATKTREPSIKDDFQTQIKAVLSHILELLKASLKDAFIQYINSKLNASQVPSVDEFMEGFKHTVAVQGVTKDMLLSSLNDVELELLTNAQAKKVINSEQEVPSIKETSEVLVELQKEHGALEERKAAIVTYTEPVVQETKVKTSVSVFDSLDSLL